MEETISKQEFSRKRQELSLEAEQIEKETGRCDGEKRNREEKVKKTAEILKSGDKILAALFCLMIKDVEIDGRRLVFHLDLPAINWLESEKGEIRVRNKRTMIDKEIEVDYLDMNFRKQHGKYTGFVAEIIQHEVDHTNGIII